MRRGLGLLLVLLVLLPTAATAHSQWVETDPEQGAILETVPAEATMTFNEPLKTAAVALAAPDGTVHKLTTQIVGSAIKVRLPAEGPRGEYTLSYRVVSADGHPVSGSSTFTVTTGLKPSASPEVSAMPTPNASAESARGPLVPIVIGVAIVGVAAMVLVARSIRR